MFFKYLCNKTKKIPNNPAQDLESPKLWKRLPKYLSLEESKKLLEVAGNPDPKSHGNHDNSERNYAIITLFLNCGMRLNELVSINVGDIDSTEKYGLLPIAEKTILFFPKNGVNSLVNDRAE